MCKYRVVPSSLIASVMSNSLWPPWTAAHQAPLSLGILQAGILEWVAMPSSRRSSPPRDRTYISCIAGRFFITEPPGKPLAVMLDLRNPMSPQAWPVNALQQTLAACALLGGVSGTQLRGTIIISVFLLPRLFLNIWSFDYFTTFT